MKVEREETSERGSLLPIAAENKGKSVASFLPLSNALRASFALSRQQRRSLWPRACLEDRDWGRASGRGLCRESALFFSCQSRRRKNTLASGSLSLSLRAPLCPVFAFIFLSLPPEDKKPCVLFSLEDRKDEIRDKNARRRGTEDVFGRCFPTAETNRSIVFLFLAFSLSSPPPPFPSTAPLAADLLSTSLPA